MLSTLLRSRADRGKQQRWTERSPFSSPFGTRRLNRSIKIDDRRRTPADDDDDDDDDNNDEDDEEESDDEHGYKYGEDGGAEPGVEDEQEEDEDDYEEEDPETAPLLPIFEASHLDALPVYNLTHAIRLLIVSRCETTLTWDQLRSPQISQFMVKPIQKDILTSHFSRATIYALIANCLQFNKEVHENPGMSGTSKTRAMTAELLAIRLLKEYSTRELIDALSYDFFPLQGASPTGSHPEGPGQHQLHRLMKQQARAARVSALEIAIKAPAKRLLAHPLVVQQLEAIWAGSIVFHSSADSAHRPTASPTPLGARLLHEGTSGRNYGAVGGSREPLATLAEDQQQQEGPFRVKRRDTGETEAVAVRRRTATLYDPRDASLFKLSRLRVPRYRSFLSTLSLAILLGLFVAVLDQRSLHITRLEILFWFWSAGFMLDEVVGFSEQGFGLYILSFWNFFDLGILFVLFCYYCLRVYGFLVTDDTTRKLAAAWAYDVLAVTAVLLFPRLFSVLDHYRYFSQLLIAFRMMATDLLAILVLILISCSGFFVALTLSFGNSDFNGPEVAYALFQMIMGFTPAAWDQWENYNVLGRATLVLFLFITHFLVVTILITVLTNSFMAIVQNAYDEHQFVFAVNTISMVKSDALFSYIAPTNIIAWVLTPLRSCLPFKTFVRLNRTVIKITHLPILFGIYLYERLWLTRSIFDSIDLVEHHRGRQGPQPVAFTRANGTGPVSGGGVMSMDIMGSNKNGNRTVPRIREPSVATFQKDRALDEVFRRPYVSRGLSAGATNGAMPRNISRDTREAQRSLDRRQQQRSSNVVNDWMTKMGPEDGVPNPPVEQDHRVVDRLERIPRRRYNQRQLRMQRSFLQTGTRASMSVVSDPEEFAVRHDAFGEGETENPLDTSLESIPQHIAEEDADGDDELAPGDNEPDVITAAEEDGNEDGGSHDSDKENRPDHGHSAVTTPKKVVTVSRELPHRWPLTTPAEGAQSSHSSLSNGSSSRPTMTRGGRVNTGGRVRPPNAVIYSPGRRRHQRNISTSTMLYNPQPAAASPAAESHAYALSASTSSGAAMETIPVSTSPRMKGVRSAGPTVAPTRRNSIRAVAILPPTKVDRGQSRGQSPSGKKTPRRQQGQGATTPTRPGMPSRTGTNFQSTPNLAALGLGFAALDLSHRDREMRTNSRDRVASGSALGGMAFAMDLVSDLGDNKAVGAGFAGAVPRKQYAFGGRLVQPAGGRGTGGGSGGTATAANTGMARTRPQGARDRGFELGFRGDDDEVDGGAGRARRESRDHDVEDDQDGDNEEGADDEDEEDDEDDDGHNEDQRRMGKLMLARMNTLEEGFREVLKEVKELKRGSIAAAVAAAAAVTEGKGAGRKEKERATRYAKSGGGSGSKTPVLHQQQQQQQQQPQQQHQQKVPSPQQQQSQQPDQGNREHQIQPSILDDASKVENVKPSAEKNAYGHNDVNDKEVKK